ncbi:MAG TPA: hypothetical protein VGG28_10720 [Kofleriaceae bacterium]|jgi:hypothetical protein
MYFADLATECQLARGAAVRAIGWLEQGHAFSTGSASDAFVSALRRHVEDPGRWLAVVSAGVHACDLGGCDRSSGQQYVIIPARTCVYVAPDLVTHYVEAHSYLPPSEFVDAVLACPEQSSEAYVELLIPFASVWNLDAATVRRLASHAPSRREAHAARLAQTEASTGRFKW